MIRLATACSAIAVLVAACASSAVVAAEDAWSRPVPPVSPASAIYLEVHNRTEQVVILTGADSEACEEIQIHETAVDGAGVVSMRRLTNGLEIAPRSTAVFAPGGVHLMCMSPERGLAGFDLTLRIGGAEDLVVPVAIEDR
ncbi:MAG: copper chaperone PCu(A)C [Acidimicrobiia bacterium]|nr:copper chaperone PCu(A)C [Acidimicrobiia bacterium]